MNADGCDVRVSAREFSSIYDVREFGLAVALPRTKNREVLHGGEFWELDSADGMSGPAK